MMNINNNEIKYKWDDTCNCNTIIYDSLIERLEEQIEYNNGFGKEDAKDALKCIKWQKEEYDRLLQKLQQVRVETIKEFVERLKTRLREDYHYSGKHVFETYLDNFAKEITEVKENY